MREVKPTQKPVPSSDIKDLFFNSGLLDIWATSLERKYIDRFGNCHLTASGMEWIFNELVTKFKIESEQALLAAGYVPSGTFQEGADVASRNSTVLWKLPDGDGDYYRWDGDLPKQVLAGSTPQSTGGVGKGAWVSVGDARLRGDIKSGNGDLIGLSYNDSNIDFNANQYVQLTVFADLFIEKYSRVIDGIHAACDYVKRKGGGYVHLSPKTYLLEDELIPRDTVKIIGNFGGYWSGLTTLKWAGGDGTNKCVVRASTATLGSLTTTALTSTGVVDCHIDSEGCDVGFYSQYVTNGSEFSGLVVKNATKINSYILKSWFCDYKDISAILGKDKGIVIGHPMFGEEGQMNVNACGFSSLKAHSNGVNTPNGSSDIENGTGIILGKYMTANFIESIQAEGNKGLGALSYSTYTNAIGSLYIEKNAANLDDSIKYCGFMHENGGSFSALSISSLHLATNQYVINNVDLGLIIQSVGRNDNIASFKGTGRVLITSNNLRNFSNTDWSKIASDNIELMSGKRINFRFNTSFDTMSCLLSEDIGYPHIVIVPRDNYTYIGDLVLRFLSQPSGANFGKEFVKNTPIIRRISPLAKGFQKLELSSDVRTTDTYFDVYVMYAKARMGGQVHPSVNY